MIQSKDFSVTQPSVDGTNTFTFTIRVTEDSVDVLKNVSKLTVEAILQQTGTGLCFANMPVGVSCGSNAKMFFSTYREQTLLGNKEVVLHTWSGEVEHRTDGSLELQVSGKFWLTNATQSQPKQMTVSGTMALSNISKMSAAGASDANIGSNTTIVISSVGDINGHSIRYAFGKETGYIAPDGSISQTESVFGQRVISFPVPVSFYDQIPDKKKDVCQLWVTSYRNYQAVGVVQTSFWAIADPELCSPLLTVSVKDQNEKVLSATGDENTMVRFCSDVLCEAESQSRNGATLKSVTVNGRPINKILQIPRTETGTYTFTAEDSRGYVTRQVVEKNLIPYVRLTCNPVARRTAPTSGQVELAVTGNYFQGSFGTVENSLTCAYRVDRGDWKPFDAQPKEDHTYGATLLLEGLDYTSGHDIEVKVEDRMESVTATALVGRGIPVFNWGENYFRFHVPVHFGAGATGLT